MVFVKHTWLYFHLNVNAAMKSQETCMHTHSTAFAEMHQEQSFSSEVPS